MSARASASGEAAAVVGRSAERGAPRPFAAHVAPEGRLVDRAEAQRAMMRAIRDVAGGCACISGEAGGEAVGIAQRVEPAGIAVVTERPRSAGLGGGAGRRGKGRSWKNRTRRCPCRRTARGCLRGQPRCRVEASKRIILVGMNVDAAALPRRRGARVPSSRTSSIRSRTGRRSGRCRRGPRRALRANCRGVSLAAQARAA